MPDSPACAPNERPSSFTSQPVTGATSLSFHDGHARSNQFQMFGKGLLDQPAFAVDVSDHGTLFHSLQNTPNLAINAAFALSERLPPTHLVHLAQAHSYLRQRLAEHIAH